MSEPFDIRGKPITKLCCFKCQSQKQLLVQEKIHHITGKAFDKKFICLDCAGGADKVFNQGAKND